jgi:salicylate hydroxylase
VEYRRDLEGFDLGKVSLERYGYPYFTVYRPDLLEVLAAAIGAKNPSRREVPRVQADGRERSAPIDGTPLPGRIDRGGRRFHSQIRANPFWAEPPQFTEYRLARHACRWRTCPAHAAPGREQLGRAGRARRALPAARRQVMNFVGALERSDWQVESWSARGTTEELAADFKAGTTTSSA